MFSYIPPEKRLNVTVCPSAKIRPKTRYRTVYTPVSKSFSTFAKGSNALKDDLYGGGYAWRRGIMCLIRCAIMIMIYYYRYEKGGSCFVWNRVNNIDPRMEPARGAS